MCGQAHLHPTIQKSTCSASSAFRLIAVLACRRLVKAQGVKGRLVWAVLWFHSLLSSQALCCSSYVPFICGWIPPSFRGVVSPLLNGVSGNSLVVLRLGQQALTAEGQGLILGQGAKIPQAAHIHTNPGEKKKEQSTDTRCNTATGMNHDRSNHNKTS